MNDNKWKGKAHFKRRVCEYAEKIGIKIKTLSLRPMSNKWASCSTDGNLNFNQELLGIDKRLGEYVIVHELLHFVAPNHNKLWKSYMISYFGDHESCEKELEIITKGTCACKI
jgi:predicted metal-dependent hydrolase